MIYCSKSRLILFFSLFLVAALAAQNKITSNQPTTAPPQVRITQLRRFNENVPLAPVSQNLTVRDYENYLEIGFIGIDSPAPEKLTYRYRLVGVDTGWVETKQNFVQYKNLDNGNYAFEVKAGNERGYWSAPARLDFVLPPPFWERLWLILFITVLVGGSAIYFITFRVRQLIAIERLRARIAADLHDNIGAGLTEISILSEVGARHAARNSPNGVIEDFGKIGRISRALVDGMNDIVWLVNPKRDSLYDLILQLGNSCEEVLTRSGIVFRAQNLEILQKVHLPMEYRQQLYYIFKEGLHNSLKHSGANEVILEARMNGKQLQMRLQDDGKGFDMNNMCNGNGLENMKRRASMIGGTLLVHSSHGAGTLIEFNGKI
jgi:hypothetical protein